MFLAKGKIQSHFISKCIIRNFSNFFNYGNCMIPHPDKAHKGGEDGLFTNNKLLNVADGVGGWAEHGIDPGLYSKELCDSPFSELT